MSTFLLIRHGLTSAVGQTLSGRTPSVFLNELGARQALDLAIRAQKFRIAAIYSSPLERALQTASPLGAALGLTPNPDPDLIELDFGSWTGMSFQALAGEPEWQRYNALRTFVAAPAGESLLDAQNRMLRFLERKSHEHPGAIIAAVTHADVIKAALLGCLGASLQMVHQLEIEPASISIIDFGDYPPRVIAVNRTD